MKPTKAITGAEYESPIDTAAFVAIVANVPPYALACYWVLGLTGIRPSQYLRCRRTDLDPANFTISVPCDSIGLERVTLAVDPALWTWIDRGVPSPIRYGWMRTYFKRAARKIGRPELRLRDLQRFVLGLRSSEAESAAFAERARQLLPGHEADPISRDRPRPGAAA